MILNAGLKPAARIDGGAYVGARFSLVLPKIPAQAYTFLLIPKINPNTTHTMSIKANPLPNTEKHITHIIINHNIKAMLINF